MSAPAISVVMAAYNGAALIGETIASLKAQHFTDFEVVIVDDCSTDDTRAVLRAIGDPRFRLIEGEANVGPVRARNRAVAAARGRYLAALDQDDVCAPDRLGTQLRFLDANPDIVLVASAADVIDGDRVHTPALPAVTTPALIDWMLWISNPIVWSSVMLRTDAVRRLDPFTRPDRLYAEDFDLYHRLRRFGRIARIDAPLLRYRRHAGGASARFVATMLASAQAVLAERHAARWGEQAAERVWPIVAHVMQQAPVPDRAAFGALGQTLRELQAAYLASAPITPEDRRLVRWETARLWGRIGRTAMRAGTLRLGERLAVRPDHLGTGYARVDDLLVSALIGGTRRARSTEAI